MKIFGAGSDCGPKVYNGSYVGLSRRPGSTRASQGLQGLSSSTKFQTLASPRLCTRIIGRAEPAYGWSTSKSPARRMFGTGPERFRMLVVVVGESITIRRDESLGVTEFLASIFFGLVDRTDEAERE